MADTIIQRVVMPPRWRRKRLYYRENRGADLQPRGRRAIVLPSGSVFRTDTFFNAFYESYWREYTSLQRLALRVRVQGAGVLRLYRRTRQQEKILLREVAFSGEERELRVDVADSVRDGLLYFEIEAHSAPVRIHRAEWIACDAVARPIRLVVGICTFNRAAQLLRNLKRLFSDRNALTLPARVIVVDQGSDKVRDHPAYETLATAVGERLQLIEQANRGGAGGFTRCLLEAQRDGGATHVLLMDDDVVLEPESVSRAAAFLSLARSDVGVGGHMLDRFRPRELVESGSRYLPEHLRIDEPRRRRVDRADGLTPFLETEPRHYSAWWFFAFPLAVLERAGLPLPLFLRGDDVEFGCRLLDHGVPTISLPGVAVWHEPFEYKGRSWHPFYELRNLLIVGALHFPHVEARTVARQFFSRLLDELLAYDYYESWLQCEAAAAYLRGPTILSVCPLCSPLPCTQGRGVGGEGSATDHDAEDALSPPTPHPRPLSPEYRGEGSNAVRLSEPDSLGPQRLAAMQAKLAPKTLAHDGTLPPVFERPGRTSCQAARFRRWRLLLRNLLRSSPADETKPQRTLRGGGEQWYDIAGADVVAVDEPHRSECVVLRRSRGRFVRLLLRGVWLAVRLFACHRRIARDWRAATSTLTSRPFWKKYLNVPDADLVCIERRADALRSASRPTEMHPIP